MILLCHSLSLAKRRGDGRTWLCDKEVICCVHLRGNPTLMFMTPHNQIEKIVQKLLWDVVGLPVLGSVQIIEENHKKIAKEITIKEGQAGSTPICVTVKNSKRMYQDMAAEARRACPDLYRTLETKLAQY